jgi:hypothetical protein
MLLRKLLLLLISFACIYSYAQQANYKFNNFGNRSILLSGNVTGSVEDIGLTYYNPSRLTEVENTGFAFNARAYQLSSLKISNLLGEDSRLSSTNFNGVPSMAGGTFDLFGTRFAYSFISKSRIDNVLSFNSNVLSENIFELYPDADVYKVNVLLTTKVKDDWFGLTWAKKVNNNLSLGLSLFGSIYQYSGGSNLNHTISSVSNNVAFYQNAIGFSQKSYGMILKIGANYHFSKFDLGLNINVPYLEIYDNGKFTYTKVIAGTGQGFDQFYDYNFKNLNSQRKEPLGVSLGAGIPFNKNKLHLNVDYVRGLPEYDRIGIPNIDTGQEEVTSVLFEESRRNVINFGAGFELYIHEKFKSYIGFSSDFNGFIKNANIFDLSSDANRDVSIGENFIHYSVGVDFKLPWASIILGTTYTSSSTQFVSPSNISKSGLSYDYDTTKINYNRWQFVVGIEIPLLDKIIP